MIQQLRTITSITTVPYDNMALETYLLHHVNPGECILYLWQNRRTVVIGRNQNCFAECKCSQLEQDGGYLARRLSGGGAVFHDLGNLNFTFLVRKEDYQVERQTEVILQAARKYGIGAERTGRNDIVVDGKKFSGNAFYQTGDCCYHHGTILINVDTESMSRYLKVSEEKLQSKGVKSVKSRVANLMDYAPDMTVDGMIERLVRAFSDVYGFSVETMKQESFDQEELQKYGDQLSSWEWLYGRKIPFTCQTGKRFAWGGAELHLKVEAGMVQEAKIYSDALDVELIPLLVKAMTGQKYQTDALLEAVRQVSAGGGLQETMKQDMEQLVRQLEEE